jgi:hypothetical protein
MKKKIKKILLIVLLALVLFIAVLVILAVTQSKYSPIAINYPTERMIKRSTEYVDYITPLTADNFRKMLENDTTHYKIVIVTSTACKPCALDMKNIYLPMYKSLDTSEYKMYFILQDCGGIVWHYDYFINLGIEDGYFFRDDDSLFNENKYFDNRVTNIINYATQPKVAFTRGDQTPLTLIINKEGKVKQELVVHKDISFISPYRLEEIMDVKMLDFDKIDTVFLDYEYGIEYLKPVDTVTFRNYKPTKYV